MPKTYAEQLEALDRKHAAEREALAGRKAIIDALPAAVQEYDPFIHLHKLYDQTASLTIKPNEYSSKHREPTIDTITELAALIQPIPLSLYRDGSIGVRTAEQAARDAAISTRDPQITPIAPVTLRISGISERQEINWIGDLAGHRIQVSIGFSMYGAPFGTRYIRRDESGYSHDISRAPITANTYTPNPAIVTINDGTIQAIRYGSGTHYTPGDHLITWQSGNGDHANVTPADIVAALQTNAHTASIRADVHRALTAAGFTGGLNNAGR